MARWTSQQALGHAPDEPAKRAARALARPGPWSGLGSTETLVWGRCQGSGSTPYQVSVDLTGPDFRCSCPSRKQPCKHAVALLLLWVDGEGSVANVDEAPESVAAWAAARSLRSPAGEAPAKPVDLEARARRLAERRALMSAGLADFERWMGDLVRVGLAEARHRPYAFWDEAAARLVDAQVPGLAERVRALPGALAGRADWADLLLAELGRWYLAARAWRRWDDLDDDARGDLRVVLGWATASAEVVATGTRADRFLVMGVHRTDDGRLQSQRTWLWGLEHGYVVVLDFAASGAVLAVPQTVGTFVAGTVATYPGSFPPRARFVGDPEETDPGDDVWCAPVDIAGAIDQLASARARNPWVARIPVALGAVQPGLDTHGDVILIDDSGCLPVTPDTDTVQLLAVTGGRPAVIFGELEDGAVRPLDVVPGGYEAAS